MRNTPAWKVSLHGGHCGEYCDHAQGTLLQVLQAAIAAGYHTFGLSEHAPRLGERYLYPKERELGWSVAKVVNDFERYAQRITQVASEFEDDLLVLRGFEAEVVPHDKYVDIMLEYRNRHPFDYMVGSVHYVDDISIDSSKKEFEDAMAGRGGLEPLAIKYYSLVSEMVHALKPEVVGHLDLLRKNAGPYGPVDTPAIREAAYDTLDSIAAHDCILDLNTAGYRKGLGGPYLAPWILEAVKEKGIGVCFGDDSHGPAEVGEGIEAAREYLLTNDIRHVTVLTRENHAVVRKTVPLE